MKTLSIRQPWASLIIHNGKTVENRPWRTKYRGPLLIHAALRHDKNADDYFATLEVPAPVGGIIGVVDLVDCVDAPRDADERIWWNGPHGFIMANPRPLKFLPWKGQLGLFHVEHPEFPGQ